MYRLQPLVRSALIVALLASICTTLLAPQANAFSAPLAAPGDLDPTFGGFGTNGIVTETGLFNGYSSFSNIGMVLQPDGKIVTVNRNEKNLVLFRYLPSGQRDTTFSDDGTNEISLPPRLTPPRLYDVALQPDGKIVVVGETGYGDSNDFLLVRLTASGVLDPLFGNRGIVTTNFSGNDDGAYAVLVQPDSTIVACGFARIGDDKDFAVARYLPSGALDTSFGGDGKATIGFGGDEYCLNMAGQSDGKLVLAGRVEQSYTDIDSALARLKPDGTLDGSFDGDGKLSFGLDTYGNEYARDVAIQPDGKIVVLVSSYDADSYIARYLPNGVRDTTFRNGAGYVHLSTTTLFDLELQPDGKIMALGCHICDFSSDGIDFAFYRVLANGFLDPSFDDDGIYWPDFGGVKEGGTDLALLPDGRILGFGQSDAKKLLVRLWPDGTLEGSGRQTHGILPGYSEMTRALVTQPDGSLLVAGEISHLNTSDAFVTRFRDDGQVDTTFGTLGTIRPPYIFGQPTYRGARAIALQDDGKIVMAGYSKWNNLPGDFLVARWNSNGTPDATFNSLGYTLVNFSGNGDDYATALALAPDGKIVIVGNAWNGSRQIWGVARLTSSGALDTTFGPNHDGKTYVNFNADNTASSVVVQPDGKIIIGGSYNSDFFLQRLLKNGERDPSYGINGGGYNFTNLGGNDGLTALALASNGWLYAAGYTTQGNATDFALAQYQPNGLLAQCPSGQTCNYWPAGKRFINFGGVDLAHDLVLREDNQLVAAGCSDYRMAAVQLSTTDVNPATLLFRSDSVGYSECAYAAQFSGPNKSKIVLAGAAHTNEGNIALTRIQTTPNALVDDSARQDQTITSELDPLPAKLEREQPFTLEVTASSGLPVEIVSATPEICAVVDTAVIGQAEGTCKINVSQAGDAQWNPVRVKLRFTIVSGHSG